MKKDDLKQLAQTVGKAIAHRRKANGLKQEELAERLGIGNEAVSRIERGTVMPTIARLAELAEIFECNIAELLTESSNRSCDQASHLNELLSKLEVNDREMLVGVVETLARRLVREY
jgi:transcriptional regulator with XRE-family HTH domain